jgi:broad specificity phosphatase PhoE
MSTGIDRPAALKKAPAVAAALKKQGVDSLVSSTLPRAEQSMNLIAREMGDGVDTQSTGKLKTWNTGDKVAGKPEKETIPLREKYIKNSEIEMPGGESWDDFMDRFGVELRDIQERRASGEEIALIGHGHHLLAVPSLLSGEPVDPKKLASLDSEHEPGGVYAFYAEGKNVRIERLDQQEKENA